MCPNTISGSWEVDGTKSPQLRTTAAAAAKALQSCPTPCDPIDCSPPGSPSLGFSRQEHWRGLSFPSPMRESEKWKWSRSVVSDFSRPHGLQPTRLLRPWDFPGKSTGVGGHCLLLYRCIGTIKRKRHWSRLGRNTHLIFWHLLDKIPQKETLLKQT